MSNYQKDGKRWDVMVVVVDTAIPLGGESMRAVLPAVDSVSAVSAWLVGAGGPVNTMNLLKWMSVTVTSEGSRLGIEMPSAESANGGDSGGGIFRWQGGGDASTGRMEVLGVTSAMELNGQATATFVGHPEIRAWIQGELSRIPG